MRAVKPANLVICRRTILAGERRADGGNRPGRSLTALHLRGRLARPTGTTLTITAKGQVTVRKEVLQHLGVKPVRKLSLISCLPAAPNYEQPNPRRRSTRSSAVSGTPGRALSQPRKSPRLPRKGGQAAVEDHRRNILVRAAVGDDPDWLRVAAEVLRGAEIVAVTLPTLCEFV